MKPARIPIREASHDDAAAIAQVLRSAWRSVMKQFGWTKGQLPRSPAYCQPDWITEGLNKGVRFFIATSETKAIGCVGMTAPKDGASELVRLAVVPEHKLVYIYRYDTTGKYEDPGQATIQLVSMIMNARLSK